MPRVIFKCPYIKGGSIGAASHLSHYTRYIATREGAERITPGKDHLPATKKQSAMVEQLLRDFPLSRGMFEYEDYLASPTRGNASAFITRALEDNYDQLAKRENYVQYIAQRPRAQRLGGHALFTGSEDPLSLSQVMETVANHPGSVWLPIISLRREDAQRLGYDSAEQWRAFLSSYAMEMAKAMKIPVEQFRWYAAYHDEGHHPHIHMVCYSEDPKQGFLTKEGIAEIKAGLAKRLFRDELTSLYARQTERRNELVQEAGSALVQLIRQIEGGTLDNPRMEQLMVQLADKLKHLSGKKQYGYLKAPLKSLVDEIVDELAKDPQVAKAYELWYALREEVLRTYREDMPERLPLSQQKEFKRIKNIVIEEAARLGELADILQTDEPEDAALTREFLEEEPTVAEEPIDEAPLREAEHPPVVEWSDRYKAARSFLYGSGGRPQDHEQALALFQEEALADNALAMHDLGRMYADGLGCQADKEQSHSWYAKALAAFRAVDEAKPGRYVEYRIGKMYAAGLGTEQDHGEAARWFALSADGGYKYAQYSLAGLYLRGKGIPQDYEQALRLYTQAARQRFPYAAFELGKMYRDGLGCDADESAAAQWFKEAYTGFRGLEQDSRDDKLQYRIGWMLLHGMGTEKNESEARTWFEKAAMLSNSNAQYRLGKLLLQGEAVPKDVDQALRWLTASAEQGNQFAQYTLGKLYLLGNDVPRDEDTAVRWFTLSAAQGNEYAKYFLDHLDDFRGPSIFTCATRLLRHMGNIFREQTPWNAGRGISITDRKLRQRIREKKIAMGHKPDDHAQEMTM